MDTPTPPVAPATPPPAAPPSPLMLVPLAPDTPPRRASAAEPSTVPSDAAAAAAAAEAGSGAASVDYSPLPPRSHGSAAACPACHRARPVLCWRAAAAAAAKVFVSAYGVKAGIAVLFALIKGRVSLATIARALTSLDTLRFAAFLGGLCGAVRGARCGLARARGVDDKWNAAAAGALSGLTIVLDDAGRRWSVATYMACRALYSLAQYVLVVGWVGMQTRTQ